MSRTDFGQPDMLDWTEDQANTWLEEIHQAGPPQLLFARFKREKTATLVNEANQFVQQAFRWQTGSSDSKDEAYKGKCALYLYYRVLQGILDGLCGDEASQQAIYLISNTNFQYSLLNCSCELVGAATAEAVFPELTIQLGRQFHTLDLWEAIGLFRLHLSGPSLETPLPEALSSYLGYMRIRITEELAFVSGSSLYSAMLEGGGGYRACPDKSLVSDFLACVAQLAVNRTLAVCKALTTQIADLKCIPDFGQHCIAVLDQALVGHLQLLFNGHVSNIVACCIYGTARAHNVTVSFKMIIDALKKQFPHHKSSVFRQAEVPGARPGMTEHTGDTRQLYNEVFLPQMQEFLQKGFAHVRPNPSVPLKRLPLRSLAVSDVNVLKGKMMNPQYR